jgi:hypothetical protein
LGKCTHLCGDFDDCEITNAERIDKTNIADLIRVQEIVK